MISHAELRSSRVLARKPSKGPGRYELRDMADGTLRRVRAGRGDHSLGRSGQAEPERAGRLIVRA